MRKASLCILVACLRPLAAAVFDGRVLEDHNGNPLPRVEIRVTRPNATGIVVELETDSQGRFRTPDLPDAEYRVRFSKTNFSTIELTTPPRSGIGMRLVHFGAISGRVFQFDGQPALNVSKDSVMALTSSGVKAGTTDRNSPPGEYRIYGLLPGRYRITITENTGEGGRVRHGVFFHPNNSQPREFWISGGEDNSNADFTLPAGAAYTVSGKVDPRTPARAILAVVSADLPWLSLGIAAARPDGRFSIPDLLPGNYELLTSAGSGDAIAFGRVPAAVTAGNVEGVTLTVDQTRSATLTLRAQEGCASSVAVDLTATEAWFSPIPVSATMQTEKPANLAHLAPSRYALAAKVLQGNCYAVAPPFLDLTRDSIAKPVEVVLVPPGSIRGQLTGARRPADYLAVLIASDGSQQIAFPDDQGQFVFPRLRPGAYFVIAAGPGTPWIPPENRIPPPVEVTPGAPTQLDLRVAAVSR